MENILFLKFLVYFGTYFGICYCFIFAENKEYIEVKTLFSFILFYIFYKSYTEISNVKNDYENGTVLNKCLDVYNLEEYKINNIKKDITETRFEYKNEFYDLKLKDYFIPASYKSYMPCGNSYQLYDIDNIGNVLKKGARLIHLDVYPDKLGNYDPTVKPVVRGENITQFFGKSLDFEECCYSVLNNGWKNTNAPLILYLEFSQNSLKNNNLMEKCGSILYEVFSNEIFEYNPQILENTNLNEIKISELLNKIIIITNYKEKKGVFNNISWELPKIYDFDNTLEESYTTEILETITSKSKKQLIIAKPNNTFEPFNINSGKTDLINLIPQNDWHGIQIVLMNYQLFDKGMKEYMEFFKNESMVVKDISLRELPHNDIIEEGEDIDKFKHVIQKTKSGNLWADINI